MAHFPALDSYYRQLGNPHTILLSNSESQLDSDHYDLEKVKRQLMEYLAVVQLCALIVQEAEVEQAKAQEVTLKNTSLPWTPTIVSSETVT